MKKSLRCLSFILLCGEFLPALAGSCGGDTGLTCAEGQYCKVPLGVCDPQAEGVCRDMPLECYADFGEWVCGCDGVDYDSECFADMAGVSLSRPGFCDGTCGGAFGVGCLPDEYCELPFSCYVDLYGHCEPVPDECPAHCQPACGCNGITYPSLCEVRSLGFQILNHPGACGEAHGLHFLNASQIAWEGPPGATGYNVYLNGDVFATESNGPACEAAGLPTTTWDFPGSPLLRELWEIEVTAVLPEGEGPMGVGSLCRERAPGHACDAD